MRHPLRLLALLLFACASVVPPATAAEYSKLWGRAGERFDPAGRLPDCSYAGYHRGEESLPKAARAASVKDFGAKGDGKQDDTAAFRKAIAATERGAIEIPPGRYLLSDQLVIDKPNLVLRGAGPEKTVLFFRKPLQELKPDWGATRTGKKTSNYSWSGGLVAVVGESREAALTSVSGEAQRGDTSLEVANPAKLKPGQQVRLTVTDDDSHSLQDHLYSGDTGPLDKVRWDHRTSQVFTVVGVSGNSVQLDRPLRFDVRAAWKPELTAFAPTVTEVGIEDLGFDFPSGPYGGHFSELGFNPIELTNVAHCWVRNIRIHDADSGIFVHGEFNTIDGVVFEASRQPDAKGHVGHHGIYLSRGGDNLYTRFDYRCRFIHDITVSRGAGNAITSGRGVDLCFDHHKEAPFDNVFTDIDVGAGRRVWASSGGPDIGKHCGARGTFWNIRAERPIAPPTERFGPKSLNFVAVQSTQPSVLEPGGVWWEAIAPSAIVPKNLHQAQLERRLGQPVRPNNKPSAR